MPNKKYSVQLTLKARGNLRDIAAYHKFMVGAVSARKVTDKILNELEKLATFPELGVTPVSKIVAEAGFRMLIAGEHLCFYSIDSKSIIVHCIVHGSTDYIKALFR